MITLQDCIALLDQREDSPAYARFQGLAAASNKLAKVGGGHAMQSFKKDGILVHFHKQDTRIWTITAVHLAWKKIPRFSPHPFTGEIIPGVTMAVGHAGLLAALGPPSSTGGDGTVHLGILSHPWERWDYNHHSLRLEYELDDTVYIACIQRPRDVQEFEQRRSRPIP